MPSYPHTQLFVGSTTTLAVSGPHLQVLETQTGKVLHSTAALADAARDALVKAGPVRAADVDREFRHVALSGEDKKLKVWRLNGLELLSERELPKKPTDIHFTRDGQTIAVSDKFGDIFNYPLHPDPEKAAANKQQQAAAAADKRNAIVSHENPSDGTLVLGHTSLLTSFVLTEDNKYVVSADRDEHVRVSWFPQGFVVERFCLGHRKFVSAVHISAFAPSTLVSGGGDPELKLWDWMTGAHLGDVPVLAAVEPFIAVRPPKGKPGQYDDGDEDGPGAEKGRRKGRGKKGKGKGKAEAADEEKAEDAEDAVVGEASGSKAQADDAAAPAQTEEQPLVLVIRRIASVDAASQGRFVVFSAVGATALFFFQLPTDLKAQPVTAVSSIDLGKPVVDFSIDTSGQVWALVDGERQGSSAQDEDHLVRLLKFSDSKLVEVDEAPALLTSLNSQCKIPASVEDLKALDLYSALASMPKAVDAEHDPMRRNELESLEAAANPFDSSSRAETPVDGNAKTRELTQREAARLKRKQALEAKIKGDQASGNASAEPEEAREAKKARSEADAAQTAGEQADVQMQDAA
ncbi:WD40 repeat-like protein [Phanerochaete sordida]|uniref:WD40 repeat-like protein n=1 Tax=Phanerochaete sordida TaxID=48140 RepID=A0A9P3GAD3_9APHY|nr:WD40 repeat-like protein [Phanerochaete sordida]